MCDIVLIVSKNPGALVKIQELYNKISLPGAFARNLNFIKISSDL